MIKNYRDWFLNENESDYITSGEFDKYCEFGDPKKVLDSILDEEEFAVEFEDKATAAKISEGFKNFARDAKDVKVAVFCTDTEVSNTLTWSFDPYKHKEYYQETGYGIYRVDLGPGNEIFLRTDEQSHVLILASLNGFLAMLNIGILPYSCINRLSKDLLGKLGASSMEDFIHKNRGRIHGSKFGL